MMKTMRGNEIGMMLADLQRSLGRTLMAFLATALVYLSPARADVTFDWAAVGDVGNPADPLNSGIVPGIGSVSNAYRIATKEVNLTQYAEFLNAVAATDSHALYDTQMATDLNIAGISRSGSSGSYTYAVIGSGLRPVAYVSWNSAARFINWLHNGQGTGSTETGVYDMSLATPVRSASATYFIPTETEWYKAAFYDPSASGPASDYWLYPTRSASAPGNVIGSGVNQANYYGTSGFSVTQSTGYSGTQNYLTDGGAYTESRSYYGTYDQGGSLREWTETLASGLDRGMRGGWFISTKNDLRSSNQKQSAPASWTGYSAGFRVARVAAPPPGWIGGRHLGVMACRGRHALALKSDGSIVSWGNNYSGQVTNTPVGSDFVAIAAGADHSLALKSDGSIVSWGANFSEQVTKTPTNSDFVAIAGGGFHSLALKSDGTIVSWGRNHDYHQVTSTPTTSNFVAIAGGGFHSLALKSDGTIVSWGNDSYHAVSETPTGTVLAASSGVSPSSGSSLGGYPVTIIGTNLGDGSDVTNVTLNGASVSTIISQSATQIVVTAAAGTIGTGEVVVYSTHHGITSKADVFTYLKVNQAALVFAPTSPQAYASTNGLSVNGGSGTGAVSYAVISGPGLIVGGSNLTVTAGSGSINIVATKAQDALYLAASATGTVAATKASQTITFPAIVNQVTTNKVGLAASASSGLIVSLAVGAGPAALSGGTNLTFTGAGSVSIVASQGGNGNWKSAANITNTFNVTKAAATVTLQNLAQTYNGTVRTVTATTMPAGLAVAFAYNGSATAPTMAGTYAVTGTVNDLMYQGSSANAFVVSKAIATVTLGSLVQVYYVGTPPSATAVTDPAGLTVDFTYDGSATAPTNLGTYAVTGTINNVNYEGSANGIFQISGMVVTGSGWQSGDVFIVDGGWKWMSWFGWFYDSGAGWVYHQNLGWLYVAGTTPDSILLWAIDMGKLWTSSTAFPFLYRLADDTWLWYLPESSEPQWFYNFRTLDWETH